MKNFILKINIVVCCTMISVGYSHAQTFAYKPHTNMSIAYYK